MACFLAQREAKRGIGIEPTGRHRRLAGERLGAGGEDSHDVRAPEIGPHRRPRSIAKRIVNAVACLQYRSRARPGPCVRQSR
jgi:hypothetical protein